MQESKRRVLTLFHIVMINVIAVDSIRTLPFSAEYGFSLLFYYLIAGLFFFIPGALIFAEMGTKWPRTGGLYIWIREAFGPKIALIIIWLNWVYNLAWYPTIMALIAGVSAYLIDPSLENHRWYMIAIMLSLFWIATLLNCFGMKLSGWISTFGALFGTLIPMGCIIILVFAWLMKGLPSQIEFSWSAFFPQNDSINKLGYFSNVLFGLIGLEMVATHAAEMKNPQRDYPKALFISAILILGSIVLASLAIAIVVPNKELSLVTGAVQAFSIFLKEFGLSPFIPVIVISIILGSFGSVAAWVIGPTKGIMVAAQDGNLPILFTKTNRQGVPIGALLLQGVIVSILSLIFVFMDTVNNSFWFLSVVTAQLAMIVYAFLFASYIKLIRKPCEEKYFFRVPGGTMSKYLIAGLGLVICIFALLVGFIPPQRFFSTNLWHYVLSIIGGMVLLSAIPLLFYTKK